uniref:Uncharacterized protein n=1 Tax=Anguilla anguilla TaxID=7936 RepID=A0A0E9TY25_ANGAN
MTLCLLPSCGLKFIQQFHTAVFYTYFSEVIKPAKKIWIKFTNM